MKSGEETGWIASDEADLRRRLEAVAETTSVDDEAWEKIQERITAAGVVSVAEAPSRRPVALAAAAAVVALVIGVLTILQREDPSVVDAVDEDSTTTTSDDRRPTTTHGSTTTTEGSPGSESPEDVLRPPPGSTAPGTSSPTSPGTGPGGDTGGGSGGGGGGGGPGGTTPTPTTSSTTLPPGGGEYRMALSASEISQGQSITISSVTPCRDDVWDEMVSVSIVHQGVEVGWQLPPVNGAGAWSWAFSTTTNNPPGTYEVHALCRLSDPENPDTIVSWDYDQMAFTLLPP